MHLVDDQASEPIESVDQLVNYFASAGKPRSDWRIGTEHEMIGVYSRGMNAGKAPPYDGEQGILAVFNHFLAQDCWKPIHENDTVIALVCAGAQMTFEPGGQLEHALRPLRHAEDLAHAMAKNVQQVAAVSNRLGLSWLSVGFRPFGSLEEVPWMPKRRYAVMREYLPTRGALAHEMMKRTATVQVNLDFADQEDALRKMRCVMAVTPILTSIYANSPVVDGKLTDYQSYRARIWLDTDSDRCGLLPFVFEDCDVFRAYTEWALDVPMFFLHRREYLPVGGMTFRRFLREGYSGERANMNDWALHLSTLFPEARLKKYMEVRGCDAGSFETITALGVLSRALLYDDDACREATALTGDLDFAQRVELQAQVPRTGLKTRLPGQSRTVGDLAVELMKIATASIERLEPSELPYLAPLAAIVDEQRSQADRMAAIWRQHNGDCEALIKELAYPGLGRPFV